MRLLMGVLGLAGVAFCADVRVVAPPGDRRGRAV